MISGINVSSIALLKLTLRIALFSLQYFYCFPVCNLRLRCHHFQSYILTFDAKFLPDLPPRPYRHHHLYSSILRKMSTVTPLPLPHFDLSRVPDEIHGLEMWRNLDYTR